MQKLAGILMIIGTALILFGESRPIVETVYSAGDLQTQLDAIAADPSGWATLQLLMAAGAVAVAIGLVLFAIQIFNITEDRIDRSAAVLAAASGALAATATAVERVSNINSWTGFGGFSLWPLFWMLALILTGFVMLRTGYPKWLGWLVAVGGPLSIVATLFIGGVIFSYTVVLVMGLVLLIKSPPQPAYDRAELSAASA